MVELGFASQINQFLEAPQKGTRVNHARLKTSREICFSSYTELRNLAHNSKLMERAILSTHFFNTHGYDFIIDDPNFCRNENSKTFLAIESFKSLTNSYRCRIDRKLFFLSKD